jgi:hypothetical protein
MKATNEAMSSKEMGSYNASRVFIVCLQPHNSHKTQPLYKAFIGPRKTFYTQETEKWLRSNLGRFVTVYQIGKLFGKYKQAATDVTAANGCRVTGLFPCDMNVFRPQDFLLVSGNTDAIPVNSPALVKTSDRPSFSCLIFRRSLLLKFFDHQISIRYQPCAQSELNLNPRCGTARK